MIKNKPLKCARNIWRVLSIGFFLICFLFFLNIHCVKADTGITINFSAKHVLATDGGINGGGAVWFADPPPSTVSSIASSTYPPMAIIVYGGAHGQSGWVCNSSWHCADNADIYGPPGGKNYNVYRTTYNFDLSGIPAGNHVVSAKFLSDVVNNDCGTGSPYLRKLFPQIGGSLLIYGFQEGATSLTNNMTLTSGGIELDFDSAGIDWLNKNIGSSSVSFALRNSLDYDHETPGEPSNCPTDKYANFTYNNEYLNIVYSSSINPLPTPETSTSTLFYNLGDDYFVPQNITCQGDLTNCDMVFSYSMGVFSRSISSSTNSDLPSYPRFKWAWNGKPLNFIVSSTIRFFIDVGQTGNYVDFVFPRPTSSSWYTLQIHDSAYTEDYALPVYVRLIGSTTPYNIPYTQSWCNPQNLCTGNLNTFLSLNTFGCIVKVAACAIFYPTQNSVDLVMSQAKQMLFKFPLTPITTFFNDVNLAASGTPIIGNGKLNITLWSSSTGFYSSSTSLDKNMPSWWYRIKHWEIFFNWFFLAVLPCVLITIKFL